MTPPETVVAAMPGTLPELAERTGFEPAVVLRLIVRARIDGLRVNVSERDGVTTFILDDATLPGVPSDHA